MPNQTIEERGQDPRRQRNQQPEGTSGEININQMMNVVRSFISDANFFNTAVLSLIFTDVVAMANDHNAKLSLANTNIRHLNGIINALYPRFGLTVPAEYVYSATDATPASQNGADTSSADNDSETALSGE